MAVKKAKKTTKTKADSPFGSKAQEKKIVAGINAAMKLMEASGEPKQKPARYREIIDGRYENDIRPEWWNLPSPLQKVVESLTEQIEAAAHRRLINLGKKPEQEHYSFKKSDEVSQFLANALCEHISRLCTMEVASVKLTDFRPNDIKASKKALRKPRKK